MSTQLEIIAASYEAKYADKEWNNGETAVTRPACTPVATWLANSKSDYTIQEYGESLASLTRYIAAAQECIIDKWSEV